LGIDNWPWNKIGVISTGVEAAMKYTWKNGRAMENKTIIKTSKVNKVRKLFTYDSNK